MGKERGAIAKREAYAGKTNNMQLPCQDSAEWAQNQEWSGDRSRTSQHSSLWLETMVRWKNGVRTVRSENTIRALSQSPLFQLAHKNSMTCA